MSNATDRIEALREKRLASGSFVLASVKEDAKNSDSSLRVRPRRLRHCDQTMRHLYRGVDYRCERCGLVIEVYDDLIIDGCTGRPALLDQSSFRDNLDPLGSGRTIPKHSINQKTAMATEAEADGIKPTARKYGISPSTLRNYIRQVAA